MLSSKEWAGTRARLCAPVVAAACRRLKPAPPDSLYRFASLRSPTRLPSASVRTEATLCASPRPRLAGGAATDDGMGGRAQAQWAIPHSVIQISSCYNLVYRRAEVGVTAT